MKKVAIKKNTSSTNQINTKKTGDENITSVLQALPVGVIIYTLKNILFANKAAFDVLKFNKKLADKIEELTIFDFLEKQYHKTVKDNTNRIFKGQKVIPQFYKLKNQKGEEFYIETKSNAINFKEQKAIQAVFSDITKRVKTERELIDKQSTIKLLTENSSDIIFLYNYFPKEHYSYVSDSVKNILGYSPADFYKDPAFINKILLDSPGKKPNIKSLPKKSVKQFKKKDGTTVWLETRYSLLKSHSGETITLVGASRDISNEKDAVLQLKESEEKFKIITQNVNDLIYFFTYQPKPKYLYVNPSVKNVLGYTDKDFYANPNLCNSIVVNKKEYKAIELRLAKEQKAGTLKRSTQVFQYISKSGKPIWLKDDYTPIFDETGKVNYILGISRDITSEKQAQFELEQKWNDYKNLIETAPIGIFIHEYGKCLYCNKVAANFLEEKDPKKLIGKNLVSFISPEQRVAGVSRIKQAANGTVLNDLAYKIITTKNNIIDVELKSVPIIFNGKNCVQTIVYNITAEKKLAQEVIRAEVAEDLNKQLIEEIKFRKRVQKELISQSSKYEAIFNNTAHMVGTINKDLIITSFNQNYFQYLKQIFNHEVKIGDHLSSISSLSYQNFSYEKWKSKLSEIFNSKEKINNLFFEIQNKDLNNKTYYREIYLHPLYDNNGSVEEVAVIGHDVTERKVAEEKIHEQSAKLSAIFNSGEQLIWTVNKNYAITSFNQNFSDAMYELYGIRPDKNINEAFNPLKGSPNNKHDLWLEKYDEVFHKKKNIKFSLEQVRRDGKKYFRQIFISPIVTNNEVNELSCISYDITELNYLQSESLKMEQRLNSIFQSSSHIIWTINKNYLITSFNQNFADIFEQNYNVKPKLNTNLAELLSEEVKKEYINYWYEIYARCLKGEKLKLNRKEINPHTGEPLYREIFINPIKNKQGEIIELACLAHDITETKNFENRILNQSAKLKAIFESGNQLMWTINKKLELTSFNQNYANAIYNLYGFYPQENKGIRQLSGNKTKPFESLWDEKYHAAFEGRQVEFTTERNTLNGHKVFRQYYLYPIKNVHGEVEEVSGLGFDITENKLNEVKIMQSLKEKEVLLKEVHHRVKNNMQVISSILNLQSSYVKDEYALNLLKECQNRIKTMAFIHESLYQTKNFESVNFSEYVTVLTKNLVHSYSLNSQKIKLILTLDNLFLNLDTSIPCGLIINEIVSNSLKYAFSDNRDGIIFVNLKTNNNKVSIEVGDNGVGIPETLDIKSTQTLGLQLVDTLIEQIGGTLKLDKTKGTKFIIEFKI